MLSQYLAMSNALSMAVFITDSRITLPSNAHTTLEVGLTLRDTVHYTAGYRPWGGMEEYTTRPSQVCCLSIWP